ncbi:hypothetical protein BO71DRAFT_442513 [Aspergillus ellipticus CBS 707.79]|uniref:Uncharacterized protein n=1 Tax=Aspergillus ellipticus CBS 707.79 TaxID=1448320 RepID=A0A319DDG8_9EURO|nr:hypothetical protein BO71DRAFT_442513 [Aspergillus ellipticus CBS 707.79]
MSSISSSHSQSFYPPQSAQPYRSLFGGPSSQDVADLVPYPDTRRDEFSDQEDFDVVTGERLPLFENDLSDDASYIDSDDDDESGSDRSNYASTSQLPNNRIRGDNRHGSDGPSSPSYRPNHYTGPASTWRTLTAQDRRNAQALDDVRARDLTAHLYNAYALRVRALKITGRLKETQTKQPLSNEMEAFMPPRRWTAWPMPSDEVPRPDEEIRRCLDDAWSLRMQPDPRPSAELEESIMAIMLKTGKERFMAREWESRIRNYPSHHRKASASQPGTQDESTGWESERDIAVDAPLRPVVQADDDVSRRQLRPLTRNILTQLDGLLMGLHRARKGGAAADDSSASEWQSDTESMTSGSLSPKKRKIDNKRERSQSRGRKRTRRSSLGSGSSGSRSPSAHTQSDPTSSQADSRERSRSQSSSRSRSRSTGSDGRRSGSRARLGLRDWSEVLGVASMIGWPPAVVMRTAKRCANMFGEDMAFQVFKEGKVQRDAPEEGGPVWEYAESESESESSHEPEFCPESRTRSPPPSQPPSRQSQSRRTSSRRGTSTRRGGSTSRANSTAPKDGDDSSRLKGKGEHRKNGIVCPIPTCSRHSKGFSRIWNLNLHMKRMHPNYRAKSSDRMSSTGTHDPNDE